MGACEDPLLPLWSITVDGARYRAALWALGQNSALTKETVPGMELAEDRCSRSWGRVTQRLLRARCQAWGGGEVGSGRGELDCLPESESGWGFLEATVSLSGRETETQRADGTRPMSCGKF